jgi:hypothetical protein
MMPALDQPQTLDTDQLSPDATYRLANQELIFYADAQTDLRDLQWPWTQQSYARRIVLRVIALRDDPLTPLVTRFYPGYQEVILGNEGAIISKRLAAPLNSHYDRAVLWTLECQAEGDRLLRLEIDIDWGEPLTQRIVDGLLVAQRNPGPAQGIYDQSNADSTRVFGNPYGRPDQIELDDPQRARLVYHVLVNGTVEVPLILTVSDVGEQVAWNGFLALRDTERVFELSVRAWNDLIRAGRLWTPDPHLNQAVQRGRIATAHHLQRLRSGFAPSDCDIQRAPALVNSLDVYDKVQSRNLLAHIRRVAERSQGRLPPYLPASSHDPLDDPGAHLLQTNGAYLLALSTHLQHHFDAELLAAHYDALKVCSEALIGFCWQRGVEADGEQLAYLGVLLRRAVGLAVTQRDSVNAVRWESEACEAERQAEVLGASLDLTPFPPNDWVRYTAWETPSNRAWGFADPWRGITLAGQAIWQGCGLAWSGEQLSVQPTWPTDWPWWALLDLPIGQGKLSLLWDGSTLHTTQSIYTPLPSQIVQRIHATQGDEHDFNLRFELKSERDGQPQRTYFRPQWLEKG